MISFGRWAEVVATKLRCAKMEFVPRALVHLHKSSISNHTKIVFLKKYAKDTRTKAIETSGNQLSKHIIIETGKMEKWKSGIVE